MTRITRWQHRAHHTVSAVMIAAIAVIAPGIVPSAGASPRDLLPPVVSLWHDLPLADPAGTVRSMTHDRDGNLWYYDSSSRAIVSVDSDTHAQREYDIGGVVVLADLAASPDGLIWFSDHTGSSLDSVDPVTGTVSRHPLGGTRSAPTSIAVDENGDVWFSDATRPELGRMLSSGLFTFIPEPTGRLVLKVFAAPSGPIWLLRQDRDQIENFDPLSGHFFSRMLRGTFTGAFAVSSTGDVWLGGEGFFTRYSSTGTVTVFKISAPGADDVSASELAASSGGAMNFIDPVYGFGTLSPTGSAHFSRLGGSPEDVEFDGAGVVWVSDAWSHGLLFMGADAG